jgi:peroxiredoxin Q/BCP
VVLGVSADSVKKHANFKKKYDLPFTLLADTDHEIVKAYGVWAQKSMFGKKYMGIERTTFIIDAKGKIARVFEKVQPLGHAKDVVAAVAELG